MGSFVNVLVSRRHSGMSLLGRSRCFSCGRALHWHELVPLLSFFFLRGRCASCKARISPEYPLVELLSGVFVAAAWYAFAMRYAPLIQNSALATALFVSAVLFFMALIAIAAYDIRHTIIPNRWAMWTFALAAMYALMLSAAFSDAGIFVSGLAGSAALFVFFSLVFLVTGGRGMGFGDAKLSLGIGMFLGLSLALSATALAFWIGAAFALLAMFLRKVHLWRRGKDITMKSEVPFAPFLVLGAFLSYVLDINIFFR